LIHPPIRPPAPRPQPEIRKIAGVGVPERILGRVHFARAINRLIDRAAPSKWKSRALSQ
jgi:hypothetical protein